MLRKLESVSPFPHEIEDVVTEYGQGASIDDVLDCVGKLGKDHRPSILLLDDGVKENAVGLRAMRESRCSFVVFSRQWMKTPPEEFIWRLAKAWPAVTSKMATSRTKDAQCKIEVSINAKMFVTNL